MFRIADWRCPLRKNGLTVRRIRCMLSEGAVKREMNNLTSESKLRITRNKSSNHSQRISESLATTERMVVIRART